MPNVALMEQILSEGWADVCYMGTDGIEKEIISKYKLPYYTIKCPKLIRGGGFQSLKQNVKIPFALRQAQKQAEVGLKTFQPDLVFSKGGYVALPVVLAAKKLGIPCFAHESDLSVGLANKLSAKKCLSVFTSFPETAEKLKNGKYSGAPIRQSVFGVTASKARKEFGVLKSDKVLLIFGGGSGSEKINQAIRKNVKRLCEHYVVLHVCGKGNLVESNVKNYRQFEFISDMGMTYACCDLVICRSGAGAVFETLALKKPTIFIPLEGQTRGDQAQNAAYFARKGLCKILRENELDLLVDTIEKTFSDNHLKSNLEGCKIASGNDKILKEIRAVLRV